MFLNWTVFHFFVFHLFLTCLFFYYIILLFNGVFYKFVCFLCLEYCDPFYFSYIELIFAIVLIISIIKEKFHSVGVLNLKLNQFIYYSVFNYLLKCFEISYEIFNINMIIYHFKIILLYLLKKFQHSFIA